MRHGEPAPTAQGGRELFREWLWPAPPADPKKRWSGPPPPDIQPTAQRTVRAIAAWDVPPIRTGTRSPFTGGGHTGRVLPATGSPRQALCISSRSASILLPRV